MRYLTTDYLYNLDVINYTKTFFTDEGMKICILFPKNTMRSPMLAISRAYTYNKLGITLSIDEFDVFEIDYPIVYSIIEEEIVLDDEETVKVQLTMFAKLVSNLLLSFGLNCFGEYRAVRKKLRHMVYLDKSSVPQEPSQNELELSIEYHLTLIYERPYFFIRNSEGRNLLKFNNFKTARIVLNLLIESINQIVCFVRNIK